MVLEKGFGMFGLVEWLKELTIFMVICETILSFAPTTVYKQYIKPFVGLIVLLWITSFLFGAVQTDWNQKVKVIFEDYERSVSNYLTDFSVVEREYEDISKDMDDGYLTENDDGLKLNNNLISIDDIIINPIKIGE